MHIMLDVLIGFFAGLLAVLVFAIAERVFFRRVFAAIGSVLAYCLVFWTVFLGTTVRMW